MSRNQTFLNADGLTIGFGTHSSDNDVGAVAGDGVNFTYRRLVTGVDIPAAFALTDVAPQEPLIPRGSIIQRATFQVITAFTAAGAATMDIGTFGTVVVDDINGIGAALSIAELTSVGETNLLAGALVADGDGGIGVGGISNTDVFVSVDVNTGPYTAGTGLLIVEYSTPFIVARTIAN